jgi:hypothetical protein
MPPRTPNLCRKIHRPRYCLCTKCCDAGAKGAPGTKIQTFEIAQICCLAECIVCAAMDRRSTKATLPNFVAALGGCRPTGEKNYTALSRGMPPASPPKFGIRQNMSRIRPSARSRHVPAFMLSLYFWTQIGRLVVSAKYKLHGCYRSGEIAVETCKVVHFRVLQQDPPFSAMRCVPAITRRRDFLCVKNYYGTGSVHLAVQTL